MHPDYYNHPGHADYNPALDTDFLPKQNTMSDTFTTTTAPRHMSGGEYQKSPAQLHLEKLIQAEEDVFHLIDIAEMVDGKFLYFIQTPFSGFPKYVIGITDAENKSPRILLKSGAEWSADKAWAEFRHHPALQSFDTEAL